MDYDDNNELSRVLDDKPRVRLAKLLASRGVASRREAEKLITDGSVTVNGEVVDTPAYTVDPDTDQVRIDGKPLPAEPEKVYLVMYKPRGMVVGRDEERGRSSVYDVLDELGLKVDPVGRLDFNTEGALLLTNDGELAHKLTHPSTQVPKRYMAKVYRTPTEKDIRAIERGVVTPEGKLKPAKARVVDRTDTENAWIEVTITQSGQRVVQQMLGQLGHPVSKLRRESYATISIRGMERGRIRPLTGDEIRRLFDIAEGREPERAGHGPRPKGHAKPKPKPPRYARKVPKAKQKALQAAGKADPKA